MSDPSFFGESRNWVGIAFFLFFILFGRKLWGALAGLLDTRAQAVRKELDEAATLRREAEALLADAKTQRERALADAKALVEGARAEAMRLSASAAAEAEAGAKRREQMALDRIAAAEKAAVDDVRMIAADVATVAARAVIAADLSAAQDQALVDRAIVDLPAALRAA